MDNLYVAFYILCIFIPWVIGWSVVLALIFNFFEWFLFKGLDEEKRYRYIKVRNW